MDVDTAPGQLFAALRRQDLHIAGQDQKFGTAIGDDSEQFFLLRRFGFDIYGKVVIRDAVPFHQRPHVVVVGHHRFYFARSRIFAA